MDKQTQVVQVCRDGVTCDAVVSYWFDGRAFWTVRLESAEFEAVEATENDAFERCAACALCWSRLAGASESPVHGPTSGPVAWLAIRAEVTACIC